MVVVPSNEPGHIDWQQVERFLHLLGKTSETVRFRAFPHKKTPTEVKDRLTARKFGWSKESIEQASQQGMGIYVVVNHGGDTKASIVRCVAYFAEFDGLSEIDQRLALKDSGLPEASLIIRTGGGSLHCYWLLAEPYGDPVQWQKDQKRLADHLRSDTSVTDPSRVMRVPGCSYMGPDQNPVALVEIIDESDARYSRDQILACLPPDAHIALPADLEEGRAATPLSSPPSTPPSRSMADIEEALKRIPRRVAGHGTYEAYRNILWGLVDAVQAAGGTEVDAIALMEAHSPSATCEWDVQQVALSGNGSVKAGTFWKAADDCGYDLSRTNNVVPISSKRAKRGATAEALGEMDHGALPQQQQKSRSGKCLLSRTKALACFKRCVVNESRRQRNTFTRRARLLLAVKALDLSTAINRQEISQQVLEAKDLHHGHHFKALTAADRLAMERPTVRWCIPGLIPEGDLTIIGGRAKVGKTRLAVAIAAAKLNGTEVLGFPMPTETKPVILVTDDQGDGDTADMLDGLGLWNHPGLICPATSG